MAGVFLFGIILYISCEKHNSYNNEKKDVNFNRENYKKREFDKY